MGRPSAPAGSEKRTLRVGIGPHRHRAIGEFNQQAARLGGGLRIGQYMALVVTHHGKTARQGLGITKRDAHPVQPLQRLITAGDAAREGRVQAIGQRDYSMIMGTTLIYAMLVAVANLSVDIIYVFIDPRIRLESK